MAVKNFAQRGFMGIFTMWFSNQFCVQWYQICLAPNYFRVDLLIDPPIVPAEKQPNTRGRPKGGLMFSVSKTLDPVVLSSSQHHIALLLQTINVAVIGCYYNPNLDVDDVTQDCLTAISACPRNTELVFGGDFNMKPGNEAFKQMELVLDTHGISCVSDKSQPTFHAPRLLLTMFL